MTPKVENHALPQTNNDHPKPVEMMRWFQAVLIFNLLDLVFTVYYIEAGTAVEANPLMAAAYAASPMHFALLKLSLALLGITLLYRVRETRAAELALRAVTVTYGFLVAYHLANFPIGEFEGIVVAAL